MRSWWPTHFDILDRRLQLEIPNPVQTKVQRFTGSRSARAIVGQARSTIDPAAWVRSGAIVIVNTAKGVIGEDTAGLVGATLLNLIALAVEEQSQLEVARRHHVTLFVDEFHTIPGANYEAIVGELAKYGANLVLATQSLAQLGVLDRTQDRALRAKLFSNLDGLFAFQTSAEDARYLVPELGEGVELQDLTSLGEYRCYARLSAGDEPLPTFSVQLDAPPRSDPTLREQLASASAAHIGRPRPIVEAELEAAVTRLERLRQGAVDPTKPGESGTGVERDGGTGGQIRVRPRNDNRAPGKNGGKKGKTNRSKGSQGGRLPLPDESDLDPSRSGLEPTDEGEQQHGDGTSDQEGDAA